MTPRAPAIVVRRAELRDAEALQAALAMPEVQAGTLQLPYPSVEMWRRRLQENTPDDHVLVAECDGQVVGSVGLHPAARSARRRHAGVVGLVVRADWHGRGVGSTLLAAAIDLAENWIGYTRLELTVFTDNAAALALYRKFGFEAEGTLREYAMRGGRLVDVFTMARIASRRSTASPAAATAAKPTTGSRRSRGRS